MLLKIAQVMEDNLEYLATLETIDNGKPIRESRAADIPLCVDHVILQGNSCRRRKYLRT
jgi:aldehyde dehydrogenase (NAD+)/aldehyde dehydrogenase